jgi:branched-chain amino acid transport system permease protein
MLVKLFNILSSGLIMGGVYAIIAMGMSIQYGVARILNVSHGEFIMVGAFLTFMLVKLHVNPLLAMVIISPAMFLVGFVLHRTVYKKLSDVSGSASTFESNSMLISFGLMFVLQNIGLQVWGSQQQAYPFLLTSVRILGTAIALNRMVVLLFAVAISLLFYLYLQKTRLGKAIRAVSQDAGSAALMGSKPIGWAPSASASAPCWRAARAVSSASSTSSTPPWA